MSATNTRIVGRYRIESVLGMGASSIVYRGLDSQNGRAVAVKTLRAELLVAAERDSMLARFVREAEIGRSLQHPNIVQMFDWGRHEGLPYLVLELISGEAFDSVIRRSAPLPPSQFRPIMLDILRALQHTHRRDVVHRDIKPSNIVLRQRDHDPVLMDFGIAHVSSSDLTQLGDLLGTPAFLAPEQLRGEPADHRSDIFAAGVTLYQAATGKLPFEGSVAEAMRRICFEDPMAPSLIEPALAPIDAIIFRALAKDPNRRYQSADEFAEALDAAPFDALIHPTINIPSALTATVVVPIFAESSLNDLADLLEQAVRDGPTMAMPDRLRTVLTHLRAADVPTAARIIIDTGVIPLVRVLEILAPFPGQPPGRPGHWVSGMEMLAMMRILVHREGKLNEIAQPIADLCHRLVSGVLVAASEIGETLGGNEAPDMTMLALTLFRVDSVAFGLDSIGASAQRRTVEAVTRLLCGQILRTAARVMTAYAASRDPLDRFDVVNILVQVEDLIGLAERLVRDGREASADALDPVGRRSVAALTVLLDAIGGLLTVSEEDLDEALNSDDTGALSTFIGHLRQVRLIYQFAKQLEGKQFRDALGAISERVYNLFARLTEAIIALPADSSARQDRLTALYDLVVGLEWREMARRILVNMRSEVLSTASGVVH